MPQNDPSDHDDTNLDWKPWSRHILIELQRLGKDQSLMKESLSEYNESLKEHMGQTLAVKELAQAAHRKVDVLERGLTAQLQPIQEHINFVTKIFKWVLPPGLLLTIPAAIYYALKISGKL